MISSCCAWKNISSSSRRKDNVTASCANARRVLSYEFLGCSYLEEFEEITDLVAWMYYKQCYKFQVKTKETD